MNLSKTQREIIKTVGDLEQQWLHAQDIYAEDLEESMENTVREHLREYLNYSDRDELNNLLSELLFYIQNHK